MWKCKCGESHDDSFDSCWSCGAVNPTVTSLSESEESRPVSAAGKPKKEREEARRSSASVSHATRYRDAYLVAKATAAIGLVVKAVGVGLGVLIIVAVVIIGSQNDGSAQLFAGGLLLGVVVGIPIYVLGVLVSAHAQVLRATLDTAVHSSPFLTKEEMAQVMA
jgi:hypothetical protein